MAASAVDHGSEEGVQGSLPGRRVRVHHHPDLPQRPNRLHGVLQGPEQERERATSHLDPRRGGEAVQVLQQGDPPRELRAANIREEGIEIAERKLRKAKKK